jgi:hypothetical protein
MESISWSKNIPFFKNTYLFRSILLVYLTVISLMTLFFVVLYGVEGEWDQLGAFMLPMLGVYLLLLVLFLFSTWVVIGNKYSLDYILDSEGILIRGTKDRGGSIRKLATVAGILAGNPTVAGAGMMVRDNVIFIPWEDVDNIEIDPEKCRIVVKCSFWTQVALHYPERLADDLESFIEANSNQNQYYV